MRAAIYTADAADPMFADFISSCHEWRLGEGTVAVHIYPGERPLDALKRCFPGSSILMLRGKTS